MRAQLVPLDGGGPIDIVKDLIIVGRKEDCDLRLEHKSVSKQHCIIVKTDGMLFLRDLGSTNGTRVNGMRVRRAALLPNDQITVANYKFRVYLGPDTPLPPLPQQVVSDQTLYVEAEPEQAQAPNNDRDSAELPVAEPLQRNQLPDVYPD